MRTIEVNLARQVLQLIQDIRMIEAHARCSDAFFRRHLRLVLADPQTQALIRELEQLAKETQ